MKVLFSTSLPFFLAHGGIQTLAEALMRELAGLGVEVEPVRWWDERQTGDIIHYIGRPNITELRFAKQKNFKVVMTENIGQTASRGRLALFLRRAVIRLDQAFGNELSSRSNLEAYRELDAMIYIVQHEWEVAKYLYGATPNRGHIIPHGLEADALAALAAPQAEENYLVSMSTIRPLKNTVLLAQAARVAKVPVLFLGKPYTSDDEYFVKFIELVDDEFVRYGGFVAGEEKHRLLRGARGFALLSEYESGCIAVYEAAAAGLPLLLSDLAWASKVYKQARGAQFVKLRSVEQVADKLKQFYSTAHRRRGTTFPLLTWGQVAEKYLEVYKRILSK